jgi:peptide/nickel transport system ATP-binding protein
MTDVLNIENLSVTYRTQRRCLIAVDRVSLKLAGGEALGLVGESGSGKSTIGTAVMRLLPRNAEITGGRIVLEGRDLLGMGPEEMQRIRWKQAAMIFQAAMNALNPLQQVGDQIAEALLVHEQGMTRPAVDARVVELFDQVGIARSRRRDYPHQYSGGMRQRAVIAMALACRPSLIIADEPTTALDVIVQDQILKLLKELQTGYGLSIMLISHDIAVVAEVCDRIGVLFAGRLVELGTREEVLTSPHHPYTRSLLNAYITLASDRNRPEPAAVVGSGMEKAPGCGFALRCTRRDPGCSTQAPDWIALSATHSVRCFKVD